MERVISEKDQGIQELETEVEELEQYTRREDIIITGMKIQQSYAGALEGENCTRF